MTTTHQTRTTPEALIAIAVAARKTGNREMERAARRELRAAHGISVSFARRKGATDAK